MPAPEDLFDTHRHQLKQGAKRDQPLHPSKIQRQSHIHVHGGLSADELDVKHKVNYDRTR